MTNANLYLDPANQDTLTGAFREILNKLLQNTDGMLPAQVISVNPNNPAYVTVQPMVSLVTTTGAVLSRAQIGPIPILQLGGGGFVLKFPVVAGTLGYILANDRDISLFLQSLDESAPNTHRIKSFSDAVFVPANFTTITVGGDVDNVTLQSIDGTVKISLSEDQVTLTAPNVVINGILSTGALSINGGITTTSGGGMGPITITGNFRVVGDITASGSITPFVP
jgi:hypothetical protein